MQRIAVYLVLALALASWLFVNGREVWEGPWLADGAERALVVTTFDGPSHPHELHVRGRVTDGWDLELVFWVEGSGLDYDENWQYFEGELAVVFATSEQGAPPVSCGEVPRIERAAFRELSEGVKKAIRVDLNSARGSVLAPLEDSAASATASLGPTASSAPGSPPEPAPGPEPDSFVYQTYTHPIAMVEPGELPRGRWLTDSETVWAESCTIPGEYVWTRSKSNLYEQASQQSLILPQVNFVTPDGDELDTQTGLVMVVDVDYQPDLQLDYANPDAERRATGWRIAPTTTDQGALYYSGGATLVMRDRDAGDRRALVLIAFGAGAGAVGTLLTLALGEFLGRRHKD